MKKTAYLKSLTYTKLYQKNLSYTHAVNHRIDSLTIDPISLACFRIYLHIKRVVHFRRHPQPSSTRRAKTKVEGRVDGAVRFDEWTRQWMGRASEWIERGGGGAQSPGEMVQGRHFYFQFYFRGVPAGCLGRNGVGLAMGMDSKFLWTSIVNGESIFFSIDELIWFLNMKS